MQGFISACAGLFIDTFEAAAGQSYFLLLLGLVLFRVGLAVLFMSIRTVRR